MVWRILFCKYKNVTLLQLFNLSWSRKKIRSFNLNWNSFYTNCSTYFPWSLRCVMRFKKSSSDSLFFLIGWIFNRSQFLIKYSFVIFTMFNKNQWEIVWKVAMPTENGGVGIFVATLSNFLKSCLAYVSKKSPGVLSKVYQSCDLVTSCGRKLNRLDFHREGWPAKRKEFNNF